MKIILHDLHPRPEVLKHGDFHGTHGVFGPAGFSLWEHPRYD